MAKKVNIAKAIMGDQNFNKIGTFKESTGGGTPLKKGEKLKDHPEVHRVQQPRDENGQFTYNAANAKPLKYGPSRGDTIPPYLQGVDLSAIVKKTNAVVYNGLTYLAGMKMSAQQILNKFKEWKGDNFKGMNKDLDRKKGRKTNLEKQAIAQNKQGISATKDQKTETTPQGQRITRMAKKEYMQKLGIAIKSVKGKKVNKNVFKPVKPATPTNKPTPAQPTTPNTPTIPINKPAQPETPKQPEQEKGSFDSISAKNNPKEYFEKNRETIQSIMDLNDQWTPQDAVRLIASGRFKNLDELKEWMLK